MTETLENTTATDRISLISNQPRVANNEAQPTSRQTTAKEQSMRIVLVHDDAIVRVDIRELLSRMQGIEVVGQYVRRDQVLNLVKQLRPDLVLDITVPGRSRLDALQSIRSRIPDVLVLVLTMQQAREYAVQLLRAGAAGYLPKSAAITESERAIRTVAKGKKYVWGETAQEVQSTINEEPLLHSLTPRQRQVLTRIAQGYNTKRIAFSLNISPKTVESHRAQLMERLRIYDVAGLVRFTIRMGLVKAEER